MAGSRRFGGNTSALKRIQNSGVAGVQELKKPGAWAKGFSRETPRFSDKDLDRVFCNSCNF